MIRTPQNHPKTPKFFPRTQLLPYAVASCFALGAGVAWSADNLPTGANVAAGSASFNQVGNVLNITNSNGAIINWNTFSIGAGYGANFIQSSASSSVLNRVLSNNPSMILGSLTSNGKVFLINQAGILVGQGARIDVAGFVASTLNMSDANFLAGKLRFDATPGAGTLKIEQGAAITTPSGGSVYLIAPNVTNAGTITTPQGETILAAGQTVQLLDTGTPGVKVEITGTEGNAINLGDIAAEAGRIGIAGVLVKNSGTLNASSVVNEGGRIFLKASQDAYVDGNGRIITTGTKGGKVEVLGNRVAVTDQATIDASGTTGGGEILIGGDYQGKNPDIQNAQYTYFGKDAVLKADATDNGNGGKIILWSDNTTQAYGTITARGGANGGNGGFVETSGHRHLRFSATVDRRAPKGKAGRLLLDPSDLTIGDASAYGSGAFTGSGPSVFEGADQGGGSYLAWWQIDDQLAMGDVIITTSGSGGSGDITLATSHWYSSAHSLSFLAHRNLVATGITLTNDLDGSLVFVAGWNGDLVTPGVAASSSATLNAAGSSISTNGGSITFKAGGLITLGSVSSSNYRTSNDGEAGGNAGDIYINSRYGGIIAHEISAVGAEGGQQDCSEGCVGTPGAGGRGGSVSLLAAGNIQINGDIHAEGGRGGRARDSGTAGGTGGQGGTVTITTTSGDVTFDPNINGIYVTGGNGGYAAHASGSVGGQGGQGGQIVITASTGSVSGSTVELVARGGESGWRFDGGEGYPEESGGGQGGDGGLISITASHIELTDSSLTTEGYRGGIGSARNQVSGGNGGYGGNLSLTAGYGGLILTGTNLTASGGAGGEGGGSEHYESTDYAATNGGNGGASGNLTLSADAGITLTNTSGYVSGGEGGRGGTDWIGYGGGATGGTGGYGGNVLVTGTQVTLSDTHIYADGGWGGSGGNGYGGTATFTVTDSLGHEVCGANTFACDGRTVTLPYGGPAITLPTNQTDAFATYGGRGGDGGGSGSITITATVGNLQLLNGSSLNVMAGSGAGPGQGRGDASTSYYYAYPNDPRLYSISWSGINQTESNQDQPNSNTGPTSDDTVLSAAGKIVMGSGSSLSSSAPIHLLAVGDVDLSGSLYSWNGISVAAGVIGTIGTNSEYGGDLTLGAASSINGSSIQLSANRGNSDATTGNVIQTAGSTISLGWGGTLNVFAAGDALMRGTLSGWYSGSMNIYSGYDATFDGGLAYAFAGKKIAIGTISASGSDVVLKASGAILDANGSALNVTANSLDATSQYGGVSGAPAISLDTNVGTAIYARVGADAAYGGISIRNSNTTLFTSPAQEGREGPRVQLTDLAVRGGNISYYNAGDMYGGYLAATTASGDVLLTAGRDFILNGGTIHSGLPQEELSSITLVAGRDLRVESTAFSATDGTNRVDLALTAGRDLTVSNVTVQGADVAMIASRSLVLDHASAYASDSGTSSGSLVLSGGNTVVLTGSDAYATDNLYLGGAAANVLLENSYGYAANYVKVEGQNVTLLSALLDADHPAANVDVRVQGNLTLNDGSTINAGNDVRIKLYGTSSTLTLNEESGHTPSRIIANNPYWDTTHVDFLGRSSGGIVLDGSPMGTSAAGASGSGFYVSGGIVATPGNGLELNYRAENSNVAKQANQTSETNLEKVYGVSIVLRDSAPSGSQANGGQTVGGKSGEFGDDSEDKDKKSDGSSDKKGQGNGTQCKKG